MNSDKVWYLVYKFNVNKTISYNMRMRRFPLSDLKWSGIYLLTTAIVIGAIYLVQTIWYRHQSPVTYTAAVTASSKIVINSHDYVYDLSGSEASGYGNPMKLFDEHCDPKNDPSSNPGTTPMPYRAPEKYFPAGRGWRVVIDLQGTYGLTELYWYEKSLESDSIWFYTGDMHHWKQEVAYKITGHPTGWGWKSYSLKSSSRYVMVRFNSYKSVITEMVLYGNLEKPVAPVTLPVVTHHQPTLKTFAGTNAYDFVPEKMLSSFYQYRLYQQMEWYDNDLHNYPGNKLVLPDGLIAYADSMKKSGHRLWLSLHGLPKYLLQKGVNDKDKPVTSPGMNTEDPSSYARHANTYWNLAAVFGKNKIPAASIDITNANGKTGLGLMDFFENGNEEDAYWTPFYWSPLEYFAVSSADYDGNEGKLGKHTGIKNADNNSRLLMSGMVHIDTNRVRTLKFLCEQLRTDKKFIWEAGVQYHHYSNDVTDIAIPSTKGISPEADHLREKLAKVMEFHKRVLPGVPVILGENGYDRNQHSWQKTPVLPGYSAEQSQGIMLIRSLMAAFMSGIDGYNQYMMRDAVNDPNAPGPYATSGMLGGPAIDTIYQCWYYWGTIMKYLGDYIPDAVVTENGPVWVYRLKNPTNGKTAYFLVSPTTNGVIIKNFKLSLSVKENQSVNVIHLKDKSIDGVASSLKCGNGFLMIDVGESPVIIVE